MPHFYTSIADIAPEVDFAAFTCGDDSLSRWLSAHARDDYARGRSRTTVLHRNREVIGYYSVALHIIEPTGLTKAHTGKNRRNEPQAGYLLAKLAVSENYQGRDIGSQLVVRAIRDCLAAAELVGGRIAIVDYKRPELSEFYERLGFTHEAQTGRRVMLLADARASLSA